MAASSLLVTTRSGTLQPTPVIATRHEQPPFAASIIAPRLAREVAAGAPPRVPQNCRRRHRSSTPHWPTSAARVAHCLRLEERTAALLIPPPGSTTVTPARADLG